MPWRAQSTAAHVSRSIAGLVSVAPAPSWRATWCDADSHPRMPLRACARCARARSRQPHRKQPSASSADAPARDRRSESVEVALPVPRYAAGGPRHRLVERVVLGRSQPRALKGLIGGVVPEPVLAWLEAADHTVARPRGVLAGVLARRRVAAADVATAGAAPQVEPPAV